MAYSDLASGTPYNDDFDELKNYLRVLFNPGRAVQARELTQLQTVLQNQVAKIGSHLFENGSRIIQAEIKTDLDKPTITLATTDSGGNTITIDDTWVGQTITGSSTGATAVIDAYDAANNVLFISYKSGHFDTTDSITVPGSTNTVAITATGYGVLAHVNDGIVYLNGHFVVVTSQSIVVDSQSNTGSYHIGYDVQEKIVTSNEDTTLLDNATGAYNYNAPGADRYQITPVLTSYKYTDTPAPSFISLVDVENGVLTRKQSDVQYAQILDLLARRTYDESGNYTVKPFQITAADNATDTTKIDIQVGTGKAYVLGYEIEAIATNTVTIDKARQTAKELNHGFGKADLGPYVEVNQLSDFAGIFDITTKETVELMSQTGGVGTVIGTGQIISIDYNSGKYRVYLADIANSIPSFASVRSIRSQATPSVYVNVALNSNGVAELKGINDSALIFKAEHEYVSAFDLNTISYNVYDSIKGLVPASGSVTITAPDNDTDFPTSNAVLMVVDQTGAQITGYTVSVDNAATPSSLTISGLGTATSVDVIVKYYRRLGNWKTKTLTEVTTQLTSDANGIIQLAHVDVFEIVSITENATGTDVSGQAILDTGQRDKYYDYGRIKNLAASTVYDITYRYFAHGGTGDYFTVDSYDNATNQAMYGGEFYSRIPKYEASDGTVYELRDAIDFRRSVPDIQAGVYTVVPSEQITADYNYYLPRIDKIYVDAYGNFGSVSGVPSLNPIAPADKDESMTLALVSLTPYTADAEKVDIDPLDTKNYTMSDLHRLEKRIENLEYYTALNLLEKDAKELKFADKNGLDKFKNGILVDNFQGHDVGDPYHAEYHAAIDPEEEILRPEFDTDALELADAGTGTNYQVNTKTITKSYTTQALVDQPLASRTMNVNPYNVFVWAGDLTLTPQMDVWVDTTRVPTLVRNINASQEAWRAAQARARSFGVQWGWWRTNWISTQRRWNWSGTITTTRLGQSRIGFRSVVVPRRTNVWVGDRVIQTDIIPFIRARTITYNAVGMKPNTTVKAYFDDTDVSAYCTNLTTDANGKLTGQFSIPAGQFKTGERLFRLIDDQTGNPTTSAEATYYANGIRQRKQGTVLSFVRPEIVRQQVSQSRVLTRTFIQWRDPLAQSFLVAQDGGVFIDSVDLYFKSKDSSVPVSVQIVEMENGYPTQRRIPGAFKWVDAANVVVAGNESAPVNPTTFKFDDPIYLMDGAEYAIVVQSNSNKYEVYVGEIGKKNLADNKLIDKQPYAGVLFKSQNSSTWTADQNLDLTFRLNRCVFSTGATTVNLQNSNTTTLNFTQLTPNMDVLNFQSTAFDISYQFTGDVTFTPVENKADHSIGQVKTAANAGDLTIQMNLSNQTDNLSPVINLEGSNIIVVENAVDTAGTPINYNGQNYYDAGVYVSKSSNLENPSHDLRVILDAKKVTGTEVAVYFALGTDVTPQYVTSIGVLDTGYRGDAVTVYHRDDATGAVTEKSAAYISRVDTTNGRMYVKGVEQIEDWFAPNGTTTAFATNDIIVDTNIPDWNSTITYAIGDVVLYNGNAWEALAASTNVAPGSAADNGTWKNVGFIIGSAITADTAVQWLEMEVEKTAGTNEQGFIEYTYRPVEEIIDGYSSFRVKIQLLSTGTINVPEVKRLRAVSMV